MSSYMSAKNIIFRRNCVISSGEDNTLCIIPLINIVAFRMAKDRGSFKDESLCFILSGGHEIRFHTDNLDKDSWSAITEFLEAWQSKFEPKSETGDLLNINTKEGPTK